MQWPRALYDHEEIPPPHCWDEVKQAIAGEPLALGHSLHELESAPPPEAWNRIAAEIQEAKSLPRIPAANIISRRPLVAYAAALAGLLLLGSVLWYAFNQRENGVNMRDLAAGLSYADSPAKSSGTAPQENKEKRQASEPLAPETNKAPTPPPQVMASAPASGNTENPDRSARNTDSRPAKSVSYADGNYIQITEPDGDVMRVSYKLDRMVKAMHTAGGQQNHRQQQEWNRKLEQWTSRMAQSTYVPSGGNFFDIAELVEFLNNGQ